MRNYTKTFLALLSFGLTGTAFAQKTIPQATITAKIDLVNVLNDRVKVEVYPSGIKSKEAVFRFARIIPGTYAIADYGRYIDSVVAFDKAGKRLAVSRPDSNKIVITNASQLKKITYWVNDTYDVEAGGDTFSAEGNQIFSPAGTNILKGEQFMLNLSGFLGYFDGKEKDAYRLEIQKPAALYGTTAKEDRDASSQKDVFLYKNYAEAVDNPIMYAAPDTATFSVNGMKVIIGLYAPHKNVTAKDLLPNVEKTIRAQKKFLGSLNTTSKYAILVYLTDMAAKDPKGIGALEHNNSTTAVFRTGVTSSDLVHVIGHEFFHTVTPLKIHSEQIQNFNFAKPELSQHLWFYEGATEYFASLYQVNQHLISEDDFYDIMSSKVKAANSYNDTLSFTKMSKQVIDPGMKKQYPNVYMKGALMSMCLDIILREKSHGEKGLLDLVRELAKEYGQDKAFNDTDFISIVTKLGGPEIGEFLNLHIEQGVPVDYNSYIKRMGLVVAPAKLPEEIVFLSEGNLYLNIDHEAKEISVNMADNKNEFLNSLGFKNNDIIVNMDGSPMYNEDGIQIALKGYGLEKGAPVAFDIIREGKPMKLKGTVHLNYTDGESFRAVDAGLKPLRDKWLYK